MHSGRFYGVRFSESFRQVERPVRLPGSADRFLELTRDRISIRSYAIVHISLIGTVHAVHDIRKLFTHILPERKVYGGNEVLGLVVTEISVVHVHMSVTSVHPFYERFLILSLRVSNYLERAFADFQIRIVYESSSLSYVFSEHVLRDPVY